jgi:aryl-alcohol dehydrogenase-like predicted oxidoreductase
MAKRKLGNSGLETEPWALGGNVFGWTADEPTSFKILDAFVDAGFSLIDTADAYSRWVPGHVGGESETVIGRWLERSGRRDKVLLATKVGLDMGDGKQGLSKAYILKAVEDSLRRLRTDHIDLYQSHRDDPNTPQEETLDAYAALIRQGKVRSIGASNYDAGRLEQALKASAGAKTPRYESLQPLYNLYDRADYETHLEPWVAKNNVGVIPYFALGAGFLTGKYRSEADLADKKRGQAVKKYLNERGFRILAALDEVAKSLSSNPARVALAWLISRPTVTAPIASATSLEQFKDLLEGTRLKLDQGALERLDSAGAY